MMLDHRTLNQIAVIQELVKLREQLYEVEMCVTEHHPIHQKELNDVKATVDNWILNVVRSMAKP